MNERWAEKAGGFRGEINGLEYSALEQLDAEKKESQVVGGQELIFFTFCIIVLKNRQIGELNF
jgi:hypothetical protein